MATSIRNHPLTKRANDRPEAHAEAARQTRSPILPKDRRLLGSVLAVCGSGIAFVIGWFGMSSETDVSRQMPYLASAGGVGVVLVVVALALYVDYEHNADRKGIQLVLERLESLERSVAEVSAQVGTPTAQSAHGSVRDSQSVRP
jgi:hypothetical protein